MANFQTGKLKRKIIYSRPFLILMALLLLFFVWSIFGFVKKARETVINKNLATEKLDSLKKQQIRLNQEIDKLKTSEGVEESIRDKFGLVKEGEGVVIIVDDNNKASEEASAPKKGFFSWLFGK